MSAKFPILEIIWILRFFTKICQQIEKHCSSSSILFLWSLLMRSTPRNSVRRIFCQQFPVAFTLYNESVDKDEKSSKGL